MPEYTVKLPDGGTLKLNGPEGASDQEIIAQAQRLIAQERPGKAYATPQIDRQKIPGRPLGKAGLESIYTHAATLGLDKVGAGLASTAMNAIEAPLSSKVDFDPVGSFKQGWGDLQSQLDEYSGEHPYLSALGNVVGSVANVPGLALAAAQRAPGLLARIAQSAKAAAPAAGVQAATGVNDITDAPLSGLAGMVAGAGVGAALPVAGQIASPVVGGVRRLLRGGEGLAVERIAESLASDNITPAAAGDIMDQARARGVPRMLADTGENTRRLLGSVYRQPGSARTMVRESLHGRQLAQGERLQNAISRDLGPVGNVAQQSDDLIQGASARAGPLYDAAYAAPGAGAVLPQIQPFLERPSMRGALGRARTIAAEEGRDPTSLGFDLDPEGNATLTRVPSWQTLDYAKRGIDDVLEGFRDKTTGRLRLDEHGRAIDATRRDFLRTVDSVNPDYGAARAAYAGPARERDALRLGQTMVNAADGDIERAVSRMSDSEREQFALGMRSKISENLARRTDGGDKVGYLSNSPQRRAILQRVAGPGADVERFASTLADEDAAGQTYRAALTGSPTAINMADDELVGDPGVAIQAAGKFIRGAKGGGLTGGLANLLAPLLDAQRFGVGRAGDRVREGIASLLLETEPGALNTALQGLQDLEVRNTARSARVGRIGLQSSNALGSLAGQGIGTLNR